MFHLNALPDHLHLHKTSNHQITSHLLLLTLSIPQPITTKYKPRANQLKTSPPFTWILFSVSKIKTINQNHKLAIPLNLQMILLILWNHSMPKLIPESRIFNRSQAYRDLSKDVIVMLDLLHAKTILPFEHNQTTSSYQTTPCYL